MTEPKRSRTKNSAAIAHGVRVLWRQFGGRHLAGVVKRTAAKSALILLDDGNEVRASLDELRAETPFDVEWRAHEERLRLWREETPRGKFASVAMGTHYWDSQKEDGAQIHGRMRDPSDIRAGARELIQIAEWLERRPIPPPSENPSENPKR